MTYMYGEGKIEVIELEFTPNVYSNMIDKFGKDIHPKKNKWKSLLCPSKTFHAFSFEMSIAIQ